MIIIKTVRGHEFKYYGNIKIDIGNEVVITADGMPPEDDLTLLLVGSLCIDVFWPEDVESITGKDK